jgi:hypothetical protein
MVCDGDGDGVCDTCAVWPAERSPRFTHVLLQERRGLRAIGQGGGEGAKALHARDAGVLLVHLGSHHAPFGLRYVYVCV